MFTVIKLGGCNGSGKTTLARAVLKLLEAETTLLRYDKVKKDAHFIGAYDDVEVVVLGNYGDAACGGMDTISDKDDRLALLRKHCKPERIVFYEGLMTGKTYGAMGALSEEHVKKGKGRWLYAFMDTPFEVCAERVLQRRAAAGNDAPFDPERTMRSTFTSCQHLAEKLRGERQAKIGPQPHPHPVHMVNHKRKPATEAKRLLDAALRIHHAR